MTTVGGELDIRYARNGGVAIAYQVVGDGAIDLVYVPDYVSNLVYGWESPHWRGFYERLAHSFRLILFDKRGTGLSDHGGQFAALETRMEDLHAVLDAVGSSSTVLLGSHDGCSLAVLYAAMYPERTRALALFHPVAHADFYPDADAELARLRSEWGTQAFSDEILRDVEPSLAEDESYRAWSANYLRLGASPAAAYALNRAWLETDLREILPAVRVPTLVLYRPSSYYEQDALEVARLIPGGKVLSVSGTDAAAIFLSPEIPEEAERFVSGETTPQVPD
ncbi:MAG: alpha/beta fold hydrolase, partial [Gaiellaceae bacterium]